MDLSDNRLAISLTSAKMQMAEVSFLDGSVRLINVEEEYFPEFIDFDQPDTKLLSLLKKTYNEALLRKKFNAKTVSFSLPDSFVRSLIIPIDPTLLEHDLREVIREEIKINYPFFEKNDFVFQYVRANKKDVYKKDLAIAFAIEKKIIELLKDFAASYQMSLKFIDISHFSSNIILRFYEDLCQDKFYITFYYQDNFISINILRDFKPIFYSSIYYQNIIKAPEFVNETLKRFYSECESEYKFHKAFISGENIPDSLLFQLSKIVGRELEKINPFLKVEYDRQNIDHKVAIERGFEFASSVGLAFRIA